MAYDFILRARVRTLQRMTKEIRIILADGEALSNRSTFVDLPDGAVTLSAPTPSQFPDDTATGLMETQRYKVTINIGLLKGSPELDAARSRLRRPRAVGAGSIYLGSTTRTFDTFNVVEIWNDYGTGLLDLEFIGLQKIVDDAEIDVEIGRGASFTFELQHLAEGVMEAARMTDLTAAARDILVHTGDWMSTQFDLVVDAFSIGSNAKWVWAHSGYRTTYIQFIKIWEAAQYVLGRIASAYLRALPADRFRLRSVSVTDGASPYDHWTLYRQAETSDHARWTALARDEWALQAEIRTASTDPPIAGLLVAGQDSLHAWDTLLSYMQNCCEAGGIRATYRLTGELSIELWFYKLLRAGSTISLSLVDLTVDKGVPRIKPKLGGKIIQQLTMAWRGKQGDDIDTVKYGAGAKGYNVKGVFDVNPTVGPRDWYTMEVNGSRFGYTVFLFTNPRVYPWKVYYLGQIGGSGGTYPIRAHDAPAMTVNALPGPPDVTPTDYLSIPWPNPSGTIEQKVFIDAIRTAIIATQRVSGMHSVLGPTLIAVFGHDDVVRYPLNLPVSRVRYRDLGEALTLPLSPTGDFDANGLLDTGEEYLDYPGWGIIVNYQPDPVTNRARVVVQGLKT